MREFPGYRPHNEDGRAAAAATRRKVCYARVSSAKQKDDLERQVSAVRQDFPEHEIASDVGSGLNWKRPGFLRILDGAMQRTVAEVVVANRDRLCRFAFELVEHILRKGGVWLVVLNAGDGSPAVAGDSESAAATELKDDLLAIVTCIVASNNGKRAAAHRRANKERAARASKKQSARAMMKVPKEKRQKTTTEQEAAAPPVQTKTQKLRIFPTPVQKKTIKHWLDGARFAYNLGVDSINETHRWGRKSIRAGAKVQNEEWKQRAPEALWDVPYKVRDSALLDASKACAALKAKEGTVHHTLKHRSCSDRRHSVALEMRWLNSRTHRNVWAPIFGTVRDRTVMKVEGDKQLPLVFKHDCRLQYERLTDSYYICIPVIVCVPLPDERLGEGIVAIDPGVQMLRATIQRPCLSPNGAR